MKDAEFAHNKYKIWICCGVYAAICQVISLIIIGFRWDFVVGIIAGTATVLVNFALLEKFANTFLFEKKAHTAFLLQLGRYLLFALVALGCVKISLCGGLAYAIGILGLSFAILIEYGIGGMQK